MCIGIPNWLDSIFSIPIHYRGIYSSLFSFDILLLWDLQQYDYKALETTKPWHASITLSTQLYTPKSNKHPKLEFYFSVVLR